MPSLVQRFLVPRRALTAAASVVSASPESQSGRGQQLISTTPSWAQECWGFYDRLGMYRNAVTWKADMIGRVRLRAGRIQLGQDEPEIVDDGEAAEIIRELGPDEQSQIMSGLSVYLTVPGEGFLVGETVNGKNVWMARSADEVRWQPAPTSTQGQWSNWQVIKEDQPPHSNQWRQLPVDSLVVRVWRSHRRFYNVPDSNSRAALSSMRELELANRKIEATYMSRLASAGMVTFPTEMELPVRKEFLGAADGFFLEWIARAREAIAQPGSASAAVPMPMTGPADYIDKVKFHDFTTRLDHFDMDRRDSVIKQLAVDLDVPPEALLGLADANHWTGWLIEESGFKIYLAPDIETICGALTKGYLRPRMRASAGVPEGQSSPAVDEWVVWYDASEITQRPDKSEHAVEAYDRGELTGEALRRELGMDEADSPSKQELADIILFKLAVQPATASAALKELTGVDIGSALPATAPVPGHAVAVPVGGPVATGTGEQRTPPKQQQGPPAGSPPTPPGAGLSQMVEARLRRVARLYELAGLDHAVRLSTTGRRMVLHPPDCEDSIGSCPLTYAPFTFRVTPGRTGVYRLTMDQAGSAHIGAELFDHDVEAMIEGPAGPVAVNGAAR